MKKIFLDSVKAILVGLNVTGTLFKTWIEYLDLGLKVYKTIEDGKAPHKESSGNQLAKGKDKVKVNIASTSKIYEKCLCAICQAKDLKMKYKMHNTEDCYDKPGNKSKRPAGSAGSS